MYVTVHVCRPTEGFFSPFVYCFLLNLQHLPDNFITLLFDLTVLRVKMMGSPTEVTFDNSQYNQYTIQIHSFLKVREKHDSCIILVTSLNKITNACICIHAALEELARKCLQSSFVSIRRAYTILYKSMIKYYLFCCSEVA